jgi:amidase
MKIAIGSDHRGYDAKRRIVTVLRGLGHEVAEREIDWGNSLIVRVLARYLRGIHEESKRLPHPERLARRTRGYIRLGAAIPPALVQRAIAAAEADAARLNRAFDEGFDAIVTPMFSRRPLRVGEYEGRGALVSLVGSVRFVPFCGPFNHTGQPAGAIPAGFTPDGFPLAVQLVGRPGDEATLVSLAAQIEAERPWAERVPDIAA